MAPGLQLPVCDALSKKKKDGTTMIERRKELPLERQTVTNFPVHRSHGWCTSLLSEGGEMLGAPIQPKAA
jgi:hypothetical protein